MKYQHRILPVFIALVALSVAACTFDLRRKDPDTQMRESLEVPPDLARPGGADAAPARAPVRNAAPAVAPAPVPAATPSPDTTAAPAPAAAPATSEPVPRVKLERDGGLRWLTVQGDATRVWSQVREYFIRKEIKLTLDDPNQRVLETEWISRPVSLGTGFISGLFSKLHSSGLQDKYRVRIEAGRVPQTAEVYVVHQLLEEVVVEGGGVQVIQTKWLPRPGDPQMEAEMLNKLMAFLDAGTPDSLKAVAQAVETRGDGVQRTDKGLLLVTEDMDAAWRRVGQVLERSGVTIEDRDRTVGIYYVQFKSSSGKEKSVSLFGWLVGDKVEEGKEVVNSDRFQVALKSVDGGVRIRVNNVAGEPATSKSGEELTSLLQQQLR